MSVAASEAQPDASRSARGKKSGFELPGWVEKGLIPGVVLAIAVAAAAHPRHRDKARRSCSRWPSRSPTW